MSEKSDLLNQLKIDRQEEPSSNGVSIMTLVIVALVALGGGGFGALQLFQPEPEIIEVPVAAPAPTAGTSGSQPQAADSRVPVSDKILNASGYITARRMATVSAEVMGLITDVNVEEGMTVTTGQVLAKLDDAVASTNLRFAEAQVQVAEANLGSIRANLAEAERVLKRASQLKEADFSSEASVTRALADVESLQANLRSAQANVEVARVEAQRQRERYDDHTIKAPFDGVVTVKNAQPGEIVSPSSAGGGFTRTGICTIVDMDSLEIEVDVNEAFIGRVFAGQKVEANLDAYPDWDINAHVIAIIPTADRAKATVRVRIGIDDKDARILPDMGVKVAFLKGQNS
jgi:RND family efflux transporter MFP subunit